MPIASFGTNRRSSTGPMSVQDMVREVYLIGNQPGKLSKKHMDVKVPEVVRFVVSEEAPRSMGFFASGSMLLMGILLKGLSFIYSKQLDSLVKEFENSVSGLSRMSVSSPSRIPTAFRRRSGGSSRRRRSLATSSIGGMSPIRGDIMNHHFDSPLLDLDALCAELTRHRDSSMMALPPIPKLRTTSSDDAAEVSRISSRSSEIDLLPPEDFPEFLPFDATIPDEHIVAPLAEPVVSSSVPARLKGFDPRLTFTNLQWARATKRTHGAIECPKDFALKSTIEKSKIVKPNVKRVKHVYTEVPDVAKAYSEIPDEVASMHEDELRAETVVDYYDDEIIAPRRESVASSFAPSRVGSLGGPNRLAAELEQYGVKQDKMLCLNDVCRGSALTFAQLLTLAANGEIKFVHCDMSFDNSKTLLILSNEDSSEED